MVIAIGLTLSGSAITNCSTNWLLAIVAIAAIISASVWGRGVIKIIPILLGVVLSYAVAALMGKVDFSPVAEASWFGVPVSRESSILAIVDNFNGSIHSSP